MGSVGLWVRVCLLEALAADPVHDRARAEVKNVTCATPPYSLLMDQIYGDATRMQLSQTVSGNRERPKRKRGGESGIPSFA